MPRKFQTVVSIVESMPPEDVDYNFVKKKLRSEEGKLSARDNSGSSGVRKEIKSELSAASSVALTTDCWSSRSQQSYITVTAHFIDSTWHTKTVTLSTHEISHRHTADKLATEVQKTEEKWDLITKTTAVVTDNAANVYVIVDNEFVISSRTLQLNMGDTQAITELEVLIADFRIDTQSNNKKTNQKVDSI
ncbi:hypothetical protein M8J77_003684 [Diaphorina citri]|nr:hypothetical protein M8J77_003684 [Diaphorina citri]